MDSCSNSTALNSRKHFGPSQAGPGELSGQGRTQGSIHHEVVSYIRNKTDKVHLPQTWGALAQGPLSPPAPQPTCPGFCISGSQLSFWRLTTFTPSDLPSASSAHWGGSQGFPVFPWRKLLSPAVHYSALLLHPFQKGTLGLTHVVSVSGSSVKTNLLRKPVLNRSHYSYLQFDCLHTSMRRFQKNNQVFS